MSFFFQTWSDDDSHSSDSDYRPNDDEHEMDQKQKRERQQILKQKQNETRSSIAIKSDKKEKKCINEIQRFPPPPAKGYMIHNMFTLIVSVERLLCSSSSFFFCFVLFFTASV